MALVQNHRTVAWIVTLSWTILFALVIMSCYPVQFHDGSLRYGVQAEYFAEGNFLIAFHPRFGWVFQVLTGSVVWLTGLPGVAACQLVAAIALGLSGMAVWCITSRTFGRAAAWIALGLTITLLPYSGPAMNGLRESTRLLGLTLWILGMVRLCCDDRSVKWGVVWCSLSALICIGVRVDCFAPSCVMTAVACIALARKREWVGMAIVFVATLISSLLACLLVWCFTGWFVPAIQYIIPLNEVLS